jgi:hypothetical protein
MAIIGCVTVKVELAGTIIPVAYSEETFTVSVPSTKSSGGNIPAVAV